MTPQRSTTERTRSAAAQNDGSVPRSELLSVAAAAFRANRDSYVNLGYHYVVLRGDRLVAAGLTPEAAWQNAQARGVRPDEAFCASVDEGSIVHPF